MNQDRTDRVEQPLDTGSVVIDCETGRFRMGLAGVLATQLGAEHVPVDELGAGALVGTIRAHTEARTIRTTRKEVA